ncbi:MAG: hypothetical protein H2057_01410 [Alphaproteobacteria bacterium]|nr:hypothetical protein [Alphaproteobacteria bacterium]
MTRFFKRTLIVSSQVALLTCLWSGAGIATAPFQEEERTQNPSLHATAKDKAYCAVMGYLAPENNALSEQEKTWIRGIYGDELSCCENMGMGVLTFIQNCVGLKNECPKQFDDIKKFDRRLSDYHLDPKRRRHLLTYAATMDLPEKFSVPSKLLKAPLEGVEALGQNWALLQKTFRHMFWAADDNAEFFMNLQPEQTRAIAEHWEVLAGKLIAGEDVREMRNYLGAVPAEKIDRLAEIATKVEGLSPLVRFPYNHTCKALVELDVPELSRLARHAKDLLVKEGYYYQGRWIGPDRNPDLPRDMQRYASFEMQLFCLDAQKDWPRVMPHLSAVEKALGLCPSNRCLFVGELASLDPPVLARLVAALPGIEAVLGTLKIHAPKDHTSTEYHTWQDLSKRSEKALSFAVFLTFFDPAALAKDPREAQKILSLFGHASQVTPLLSALSFKQRQAFQEANGFVSCVRTDYDAVKTYEGVLKRLETFTPQGIKDLHHVMQTLIGVREAVETPGSAFEQTSLETTERAFIWEMEALSHLRPSVLSTLTQFPAPLLYFFEGQKPIHMARLLNGLAPLRFEGLARHFEVFYEVCDQVAKRKDVLTREGVMTEFLGNSFCALEVSVLDDLGCRLKKQKETLPLSYVNDLLIQEIDCFFENAYHAQAFDQEAWQALITGTQKEKGVLVDPLIRRLFLQLWQDNGELVGMPKMRFLGAEEKKQTPPQTKKLLKKRGDVTGL